MEVCGGLDEMRGGGVDCGGEVRAPGCEQQGHIGLQQGVVEDIGKEEVVDQQKGAKTEESGNGLWVR